RLAASLERGSEHPLAAAVVTGAQAKDLVLADVSDFRSVTGKGATGTVDSKKVALGNRALLDELGVDPSALSDGAEALRRGGRPVLWGGVAARAPGRLGGAARFRAGTGEAFPLLPAAPPRLVMVTGDSRTTAESVARRLGLDQVEAEVLPVQKVETVKRL